MKTTSTLHRMAAAAIRPAALIATVLGFLIATGLGPGTAHAQPVLSFESFCEPDPVRSNEAVLMTCTVRWTNTGDEAATNLQTSLLPSSSCSLPSPLIPPLIYQYRNGELTSNTSLPLFYDLGDLGPGETVEAVIKIAVTNYGTGLVGAEVTAVSQDDPSVTAGGDVCWSVEADAEAPPTNLEVTKTLLTEFEYPAPEPIPEPPAPPDDGGPVPIEPSPGPSYPEQAEFEIVVSNVSGGEMTSLSILDVETGGAVLIDADPPANGTDPLGRPTWDLSAFGLSSLGPEEELRILATVGPPSEGQCSYANDVVVVTATPAGSDPEDYVAFADQSIPVGPCGFGFPSDYCWFYPPEGEPTIAPCEMQVCWATPPDGGEFRPVYDCDPTVEYCWFTPPGEGRPVLRPCAQDVCWFSYEEGFDYFFEVPCDLQYCEYTAPDGSTSARDYCDFPICWSTPRGDGEWRPVWGCGQFQELCWFSPPGEGAPVLRSCGQDICWLSFSEGGPLYDIPCDFKYCEYTAPDGSASTRSSCDYPVCWSAPPEGGYWQPVYDCGQYEELCWFSPPGDADQSVLGSCQYPPRFAVNPPEGAVDFGFGPEPVYFDEDACWPAPPDGGPFYTFPIPCSEVESVRWFFPPNDGPAFPTYGYGDMEFCWQPVPPDIELPPGVELPDDLLIPGPCSEGEEGKTGVPGSSVPAEVVEAVSTPAEIVEGTFEQIETLPSADSTPAEIEESSEIEKLEPLPSADVTPAELVGTDLVEPGAPPPDDSDDEELVVTQPSSPSPPTPQEPDQPSTLAEVLGLTPGQYTPSEPTQNVGALPQSGSGFADGGRSAWPWAFAAGLAAAGLLLTTVGVQLRRRRGL